MLEVTNDVIEVQENAQVDDKENKWCVYIHTNLVNGKKYVGITSQSVNDRWRNGAGYRGCEIFWKAINKYTWDGFSHEVIVSELTESEAKQKEMELIALYKTNCTKYRSPSYGYNMTDGGDGNIGWTPTEETKQNISNALKGKYVGENNPNYGNHKLAGKNNPNYGKHMDDVVKEKIRQSNLGRSASDETRQKLSDMRKGYKSCRINPVFCIELNEIFWGQQEAKNKYNINRGCVGECCRGLRKFSGVHPITGAPLSWKYVYDFTTKDGNIIPGAITLGYVVQKEVDDYFNKLYKKEND